MIFNTYFQGKKVEAANYFKTKKSLSEKKVASEKVVVNNANLKQLFRPYVASVASIPTLLIFAILCVPFPFDLLAILLLPPLIATQGLHWLLYGEFWDPTAELLKEE